MTYCYNCGVKLDSGARFCGECGTNLQPAKAGRRPSRPYWLVGAAAAVLFVLGAAVAYGAVRRPSSPPADFATLFERGNSRLEEGMKLADQGDRSQALKEWQQAVRAYEAALQLRPGDLHLRTDLGLAYLYVGKQEQAFQALQGVLREDPNYLWALFNLAWGYRATGDDLRALDLYRRYLTAVPAERQLQDKYSAHADLIDLQIDVARTEIEKLSGVGGPGK